MTNINGGASNPMMTEAQSKAEIGLKPEKAIAMATPVDKKMTA